MDDGGVLDEEVCWWTDGDSVVVELVKVVGVPVQVGQVGLPHVDPVPNASLLGALRAATGGAVIELTGSVEPDLVMSSVDGLASHVHPLHALHFVAVSLILLLLAAVRALLMVMDVSSDPWNLQWKLLSLRLAAVDELLFKLTE